jgi:hypothetical protein
MKRIKVLWILRNNLPIEALGFRNSATLLRLYRLVEQGRRQMTGLSLRFGQMPAPSQLRHAISLKTLPQIRKANSKRKRLKHQSVQVTTGARRLRVDKNFFTLL